MSPNPAPRTSSTAPAGSRYELKYQIEDRLADQIVRAASTWYERDPHLAPGRREYVITSLYLDTPRMDFYLDRECQRFDRVKARVRTYGPRNEGPVFLEIKRRFGDTMVKTRALVPTERWTQVLDPGVPDLSGWDLTPAREAVVRDFAQLCLGRALRPVVSIRYDREAYVGRSREDLRLTVDRRMRYVPVRNLEIPADDRRYRVMDSGYAFLGGRTKAVLEVKFTGRHPLWLEDLLARFDLPRESFSKYLTAVEAMLDEAEISCPGARRSRVA